MTRVAAIDCGTNSIRLLVADVDADAGTLRDVDRRMEIVRLGQGVDRTGRLRPRRAGAHLRAPADATPRVIARLGAERVRFVATSATRDAANRDEFVAGVRERLGVEPEVVTGDEEAGCPSPARPASSPAGAAAPFLVVDIGGGSTEFVLGDDATSTAARSVDIGCVRMTERHLHDDPPTAERGRRRARRHRGGALDARGRDRAAGARRAPWSAWPARSPRWRRSRSACRRTTRRDPPRPDHRRRRARRDARRLLAMTRDERAALPVMHPGRVDVIGAGALVLADRPSERVRLDEVLVVSEHDILDGIAFSLAVDGSEVPNPHWPLLDLRITAGDLELAAAGRGRPRRGRSRRSRPTSSSTRRYQASTSPDDLQARRGHAHGVLAVVRHVEHRRPGASTWRPAATASCSACRSWRATTSRPCARSTRRRGSSSGARGTGLGKAMRRAVLSLAFDHLGARAAITSAWHDNHASLGVSRSLGYRPTASRSGSGDGVVDTSSTCACPSTTGPRAAEATASRSRASRPADRGSVCDVRRPRSVADASVQPVERRPVAERGPGP